MRRLLEAARLVLARWDKGDLAEAVRELQAAVDAAEGKVPHNHGPEGCTVIGHIDGGELYAEFHQVEDWQDAIRRTPQHVTVCGVFAGRMEAIDDLRAPCQGEQTDDPRCELCGVQVEEEGRHCDDCTLAMTEEDED